MDKDKLKTKLELLAKRECWVHDEDFNPMEYSGANYDDAYYGGREDGEAILAKDILEEFF